MKKLLLYTIVLVVWVACSSKNDSAKTTPQNRISTVKNNRSVFRNVSQTNELKRKLQGSWCSVEEFAYCAMYFRKGEVCFVDADPEHFYKYTLNGDTLTINHTAINEVTIAAISFRGDTLMMRHLDTEFASISKYLPFGTISIGGKRIELPERNDSLGEQQFEAIMKRLAKQPLNEQTLCEWRVLYAFTDGYITESLDDYLAELYDKHPTPFLMWIYHHKKDEEDPFRALVFNYMDTNTGYPEQEQVRKDIGRLKNKAARDFLNQLTEQWTKKE